MMKISRIISRWGILMLLVAVFAACSDDDSDSHSGGDGRPVKPDFSKTIKTSVNGFITNEHNEPIPNAIVRAGSTSTVTDAAGYFKLDDVTLVKGISFITVSNLGYFTGIRTWIGEEGKSEFVRIKLLPKTVIGSFKSAEAKVLSTADGLQLSFPANAIVSIGADGKETAYEGDVNVAARWLDPSSDNISLEMPGNLTAIRKNGDVEALITYGMMAVELTSNDGTVLQVASDKEVATKWPIPTSMQADAPEDMPLWSFDEERGVWEEEGVAKREGSQYVGNVNHFSFWNLDLPYTFVNVTGVLTDEKGYPLSSASLVIVDNNNKAQRYYISTNINGGFTGRAPRNSNLTLNVYNNLSTGSCLIYEHPFTTTTEDINLGTVKLASTLKSSVITGALFNCDMDSVATGVIIYTVEGSKYQSPINKGKFSLPLYFCKDGDRQVDIAGYDYTKNAKAEQIITVTSGNDMVVPNMYTCGETATYISISVKGEYSLIPELMDVSTSDIGKDSIYISLHAQQLLGETSSWVGLNWSFKKDSPKGQFDTENSWFGFISASLSYGECRIIPCTISVTEFYLTKNPGGDDTNYTILIEGSYSGKAQDEGDFPTVSGSFRYENNNYIDHYRLQDSKSN